MPKLLVKFDSQRNLLFRLRDGETVIGRGEDAHLQLPNVSVSRRHARIVLRGAEALLEDQESQNGTTVNGKPALEVVLASKDEIKIGRFTLVFLGDGPEDRFYAGRCVDYLAPYEPGGVANAGVDETFAMSKDALKALARKDRLSEDARVVSETDARRFWYPEERGISFGSGAQVPLAGWYVFGKSAEIAWNGKAHVLRRLAFWVPVSVNGVPVSERTLKPGDRIRIAGSRFRYQVEAAP